MKKLSFILPALLLLTAVTLLNACKQTEKTAFQYLPEKPNKLTTFSKADVQSDTASFNLPYVANRMNVLLEPGISIPEFSAKYGKELSNNGIEIIYYDTIGGLVKLEARGHNYAYLQSHVAEIKEISHKQREFIYGSHVIATDPVCVNKASGYHFYTTHTFNAWDITMGDSNVIVAVIERGFDLSNAEFSGKIVKPGNFENAEAADVDHGTHVAGLAIGRANNKNCGAGIAPGCSFMPVSVGDGLTSSNIREGIYSAVNNNADVINMSLGFNFGALPKLSKMQWEAVKLVFELDAIVWERAFDYAAKRNCIIVQAAGNSAIPAATDPMKRGVESIIVGAVDNESRQCGFSNYGSAVNIWAPGASVTSSLPDNLCGELTGTSMASPIVAGAVALIKSVKRSAGQAEIKKALAATSVTAGGNYVINIGAAVKAIKENQNLDSLMAIKYKTQPADLSDKEADEDEGGTDADKAKMLSLNERMVMALGPNMDRDDQISRIRQCVLEGANVNAKAKSGFSALHYAAGAGDFELFNMLIRKGANVNAVNETRIMPIHFAALTDADDATQKKMFEILLKKGADVDAGFKTGISTPLFLMARLNHPLSIDFLLKKGARFMILESDSGNTLLHEAVVKGNVFFARRLIEKGVEVNVKNNFGLTPLDLATSGEMEKMLVSRGGLKGEDVKKEEEKTKEPE